MKSALPVVAGFALGLLILISFGIDWRNVSAGGTIDFRNRITGARLLMQGEDAFHYKWRSGGPPELCDPYNNPALPISRVTVTPTLLMLNFPLAVLPYRTAQFVWMTMQWLLLLGTALLWMRLIPSPRLRWLWAALVVGFTYTVAWRHHVDRGQAYVLILFLLACWTLVTRHLKFGNSIWGGLIAGLLIAVRPPLLLLVGPFVLLRRRGQIAGAVIGLALSAGLPMLWDSSCWSDYYSGMQTWSELYRAGTGNPRPPPQAYPPFVEGISIDQLARFGVIPFADSSLFALFRSWGISNVSALPVALALVALIALWFWVSRSQPEDVLLIGIAAWAFLADLFIPAPRNSYNDPVILNVLAFLLIMRTRHSWMAWLLLASWPVGWIIGEMLPRQKWIINLPTTIMIVAALLVLLRPAFEKTKQKPTELA
jgi:Glycosyltransferase family 87